MYQLTSTTPRSHQHQVLNHSTTLLAPPPYQFPQLNLSCALGANAHAHTCTCAHASSLAHVCCLLHMYFPAKITSSDLKSHNIREIPLTSKVWPLLSQYF